MNNNIHHSLRIPIKNSSEYVEVFPDELPPPENIDDIFDVLSAELASPHVWRAAAEEYYRQGFVEQFEIVLSEILSSADEPDVRQAFDENEFKEGISEIYNTLAAGNIGKMKKDKNEDEVKKFSLLANGYLNRAKELTSTSDYFHIVKGLYELLQGNLDASEANFKKTLQHATRPQQVHSKFHSLYAAHIGMGMVAYAKKNMQSAHDHIRDAIIVHPTCDVSVRTALATCSFLLEKYDTARTLVTKTLATDPAYTPSLVLLALLDLVAARKDKSSKQENQQKAYELFLLCVEIDPQCSMALNHLANYTFHSWESLPSLIDVEVADSYSISLTLAVTGDVPSFSYVKDDYLRLTLKPPDNSGSSSSGTSVTAMGAIKDIQSKQVGDDLHIQIKLTSTTSLPDSFLTSTLTSSSLVVEGKAVGKIQRMASEAYGAASSYEREVRAESSFHLGRVAHYAGDVTKAIMYYKRAVSHWSGMTLAHSLLGQLYLSQQQFSLAQEHFEIVLQKFPTDRDALLYLAFIKSITKQEKMATEKLFELAPGFPWEYDLWVLQGEVRLPNPADHPVALKCFENAYQFALNNNNNNNNNNDKSELGSGSESAIDPNLLCNIGVLHHSLGHPLSSTIEWFRKALLAVHQKNEFSSLLRNDSHQLPLFHEPDNDVFFAWSPVSCVVKVIPSPSSLAGTAVAATTSTSPTTARDITVAFIRHSDSDGGGEGGEVGLGLPDRSAEDFTALSLTPGREVLLEYEARGEGEGEGERLEVLGRIIEVASPPGTIVVRSLLKLVPGDREYRLRAKVARRNFGDDSMTACFNYGRVLEDMGKVKAALEVYQQILVLHPSFTECYIRISRMYRNLGKYDAAIACVDKALAMDPSNVDLQLTLASIYFRDRKWTEAKRIYEKVCSQNHHDTRAMLSLGNFYFVNISNNFEGHLNNSYKFFLNMLNDDSRNCYAAMGIGLVAAERRLFDTSKEIFLKTRDANLSMSEDSSLNLAYILMAQEKWTDAIHTYHAALKLLLHPPTQQVAAQRTAQQHSHTRLGYLYENLAYAHFKNNQPVDAIKTILRALHLDPSAMHTWYNLGYLREEFSVEVLRRPDRSTKLIQTAITELEGAWRVFGYLRNPRSESGTQEGEPNKGLNYDHKKAFAHRGFCESNLGRAKQQLRKAKAEELNLEETRRKNQKEIEQRMEAKRLEKLKEEENEKLARLAMQEKALMKAQQLAALQESWAASLPAASSSQSDRRGNGGGGGGSSNGNGSGKRKRKTREETEDMLGEEEEEEEDRGRGGTKAGGEREGMEVDFGSSDEDEKEGGEVGDVPAKKGREATAAPGGSTGQRAKAVSESLPDDIFGSSSEDEEEGNGIKTASQESEKDTQNSEGVVGSTRRLKKTAVSTASATTTTSSSLQTADEDVDDDDDDIFGSDSPPLAQATSDSTEPPSEEIGKGTGEEGRRAAGTETVENRPLKQRRILDDEDDDE